ncbi:hypothetical protein [Methylobacterium sp. JK268]
MLSPSYGGLSAEDLLRRQKGMPQAIPLQDPVSGLLQDPTASGVSPSVLAFGQLPAPQADAAPAPSPAPAPSLPSMTREPPPLSLRVPPGPTAAASLPAQPAGAKPAPGADDEEDRAPASAPLPPARPAEFGGAPGAQPTDIRPPVAGGPASPAASGGGWNGLLSGLGANSDLLIGIGAGLMSKHGFGAGLAAGIQNGVTLQNTSAAQGLARAKQAVELTKLGQEQKNISANANFVKNKIPGVPDDVASSLGANTTFMNELFKGLVPPQELYKQFTDKDGNVWSQNQRTGQATVALKADEDKTQTPLLTPEDRAAAGIRPDDKRAAWKDANDKVTFEPQPPSTTINMPPVERAEQAKIGESRASVINTHIQKGDAAEQRIQTLDQMRAALDAAGPNLTTGPLGEGVLRAKQALGGALGTTLPGTSATEMFNNMGPILAGEAARAITARPAQIEFTTNLNAKPGLMNSPEGNRAMMDVMRQRAVIDKDLSDIAARAPDTDTFLKQRDTYLTEHQMINPFTGQPFGSASAPPPQPNDPLASARDAIARGADRKQVIQRLLRNKIDPRGL